MNLIACGLTLTGFGILFFLIIAKEYMRRGYIDEKEVLISRWILIFVLVGLMLMAIGWAGLVNGLA